MRRREFITMSGAAALSSLVLRCGLGRSKSRFVYNKSPLVMEPDRLTDTTGSFAVADLPDNRPRLPIRFENVTPLTERLWQIALSDIEGNIVTIGDVSCFGSADGTGFPGRPSDIAYSGILGLNFLYPDIMRQSLETIRNAAFQAGLRVPPKMVPKEIEADWKTVNMDEKAFRDRYRIRSYLRRTDDVAWLWCARELIEKSENPEEWRWLHENGKKCFDEYYQPFFDETDGLYRGQMSFIDIHETGSPSSGYPQDWSVMDCIMIKALSTNCLYVKGLEAMGEAASKMGREDESRAWLERSLALKVAILHELSNPDGSLASYKDRAGNRSGQRDALGTALAVLTNVVRNEAARDVLKDYPLTDAGIPLFYPFYSHGGTYYNQASWPFVDTLFIRALEKAGGRNMTDYNAALLARTCGRTFRLEGGEPAPYAAPPEHQGTFHEWIYFPGKQVMGKGRHLKTAAAFVDVCSRANLEAYIL